MIKINQNRGKYNNAKSGKYIPINREKYKGCGCLTYKSDIERKMMRYLDKTESVVSWSYEPQSIKYFDPVHKKVRRYYIDFVAQIRSGSILKTVWIETKPISECKKPASNANQQTQITWLINQAKWQAAKQLAKSKNFEFHVINETQLD